MSWEYYVRADDKLLYRYGYGKLYWYNDIRNVWVMYGNFTKVNMDTCVKNKDIISISEEEVFLELI